MQPAPMNAILSCNDTNKVDVNNFSDSGAHLQPIVEEVTLAKTNNEQMSNIKGSSLHLGPHSASRKPQTSPSLEDMQEVLQLCRKSNWIGVLALVQKNPSVAVTQIIMDNNIATTIIHQAITSKGDTAVRALVISTILRNTPQAASIKNGYGSLPLHVISQRNTKIDSQTKERLIIELVEAYPEALVEEGGVGKRTPLHIIFTDYISPRLTKMMIEKGSKACFMRDKKGYLPAHVACSRHCSPEKLQMLLAVNPNALFETTKAGKTLLDLATASATKSHPNYALIDELQSQLALAHSEVNSVNNDRVVNRSIAAVQNDDFGRVSSEEDNDSSAARTRLNSNDSAKTWNTFDSSPANHNTRYHHTHQMPYDTTNFSSPYRMVHHMESYMPPAVNFPTAPIHYQPMPIPQSEESRKRKAQELEAHPAADLLLHFSRHPAANLDEQDTQSTCFAEV